ncbi:hypothetical protein QC281_35145 [Streptomyces sp. DH17]|nr:hypothetical protein [Streptomyces sp. DH17]
MKSSGKRDLYSPCPGMTAFAVVCSEHDDVGSLHHVRTVAQPAATAHRDEHRAALTSR